MEKLKIRDFIYLDVERLKSIVSQFENGMIDSFESTKGSNAETQAEVEGSVFGFLKARGQQSFAWQKQQTETKTLHDHIFNFVEAKLQKNSDIFAIPGDIIETNYLDEELRSKISHTSFIIVEGYALINDYTRITELLENYDDLSKFFTKIAEQNIPSSLDPQQRKEATKKIRSDLFLDKSLNSGIRLLFDLFFKDRVIIKFVPFEQSRNFRLVGNIDQNYLRESIDSIVYKYGTNPSQKWKMFAQIAEIPQKIPDKLNESFLGAEVDVALQKVFESFRGIEAMIQTIVYPEIAVTPIAIYRE